MGRENRKTMSQPQAGITLCQLWVCEDRGKCSSGKWGTEPGNGNPLLLLAWESKEPESSPGMVWDGGDPKLIQCHLLPGAGTPPTIPNVQPGLGHLQGFLSTVQNSIPWFSHPHHRTFLPPIQSKSIVLQFQTTAPCPVTQDVPDL